jgi:hypothetical protein
MSYVISKKIAGMGAEAGGSWKNVNGYGSNAS